MPLSKTLSDESILRIPNYVIVFAAGLLFVLHALVVWDWVVDDAGISFSYARNLAQGHGLVSQPGAERVEGFSNFLWVLLLAPWFNLGVFDPVVTPKIISIFLILASFAVMTSTLSHENDGNDILALGALVLTSLNTSFVVWSTSGLENPLYVLLFCLLLHTSVRTATQAVPTIRLGVLAGCIVACISFTRPEGISYFPVYPVIILIARRYHAGIWINRELKNHLLVYALCFISLFLVFMMFRIYYFGDVFPNTYYAKTSPGLRILFITLTMQVHAVIKFANLMTYIVGNLGLITVALLILMNFYIVYINQFREGYITHGLLLLSLTFVFLIMPSDWMGSDRFATTFIIFFYSYASVTVGAFLKCLPVESKYRKALALTVVMLAIGFSTLLFSKRSIGFASEPVFPMSEVAEHFASRYNTYAQELQLPEPSILIPDVGGMLYYSRLRVYDLAGLCDRTIARNLALQFGKPDNRDKFYDYVFERAKPTFVVLHGAWIRMARLDSDARFSRDYIAIRQFHGPKHECHNSPVLLAEYVRRQAVEGKSEALNRLRTDFGGILIHRRGFWTEEKKCSIL